MSADIRQWFNHHSTVAAVYLTVPVALMGVAISALHLLMWAAGAGVGFFDNPELATALRPLMAAMLLPAIGLLVGHVASWRWSDFGDDRILTVGIMGGQIAGLVAILPAIAASQANLAAMVA